MKRKKRRRKIECGKKDGMLNKEERRQRGGKQGHKEEEKER